MTQSVRFSDKAETGAVKLFENLTEEVSVGERIPAVGGRRCADLGKFAAGNKFGAAVEQHAGAWSWLDRWWGVDGVNHEMSGLGLVPNSRDPPADAAGGIRERS